MLKYFTHFTRMITRMMGPYCRILLLWIGEIHLWSLASQMTVAITSCFLCDSLSFRSYCVSVHSAADVQPQHTEHELVFCMLWFN